MNVSILTQDNLAARKMLGTAGGPAIYGDKAEGPALTVLVNMLRKHVSLGGCSVHVCGGRKP